MPQVIADPAELRRFSVELRKFNDQLRESASRLHTQFVRLGETLRDQEYQKFAQEFEPTMQALARVMDTITNQYIPYLQRKAQLLEEYSRQR